MKVTVASDIHLEFFNPIDEYPNLGEGDVLVLSGDIITAADLLTGGPICEYFEKFFTTQVERFDKVLYTAGNHEHYDMDMEETEKVLRSIPGITYLQNEWCEYGGVNFFGSTLWTDFASGSTGVMAQALNRMNDYHSIYREGGLINPLTTYNLHKEAVDRLTQGLTEVSGEVFVFTHHCPSFESVKNSTRSADMVGAYASDLTELVKANNNILHWVHGHVHINNDYLINQCRVISNPYGYKNVEPNDSYTNAFTLSL